jgi:GAF domain-containing protein
MARSKLEDAVGDLLASARGAETRFQTALDAIARFFEASTATLHRADAAERTLHLLASIGIPEKLIPITSRIPFGKGMAGICAERREPVTVCNLQCDASGVARPGAKETGVAGAIVVPIIAGASKDLVGTLGVGKPAEHTYTESELETLGACARVLSRELAPRSAS